MKVLDEGKPAISFYHIKSLTLAARDARIKMTKPERDALLGAAELECKRREAYVDCMFKRVRQYELGTPETGAWDAQLASLNCRYKPGAGDNHCRIEAVVSPDTYYGPFYPASNPRSSAPT